MSPVPRVAALPFSHFETHTIPLLVKPLASVQSVKQQTQIHGATLENPKHCTYLKTACLGCFIYCIPIISPSDTSLVTKGTMTLFRLGYIICFSGILSVIVQDLSIGSASQTPIYSQYSQITSSVKKEGGRPKISTTDSNCQDVAVFSLPLNYLGSFIALHLQRQRICPFSSGELILCAWAVSILRIRATSYQESRIKFVNL